MESIRYGYQCKRNGNFDTRKVNGTVHVQKVSVYGTGVIRGKYASRFSRGNIYFLWYASRFSRGSVAFSCDPWKRCTFRRFR